MNGSLVDVAGVSRRYGKALALDEVEATLAELPATLRERLSEIGFAPERSFTRMVHGPQAAPGETALVVLVAGPELG